MKVCHLFALLAGLSGIALNAPRLARADSAERASLTVEVYLSDESKGRDLGERVQLELREGNLKYVLRDTDFISLDRVLDEPTPDAEPVLPKLWIAWKSSAAHLFLRDRQKDRVYVRRLLARGRSEAVRQEELVELVRSLAEALAEGAEIGIRTSEAKRIYQPPSPAAHVRPLASPWHVSMLLSYEVGAESDEIPLRHGAAAGGALFFREGKTRTGIGLSLGFSPASFDRGALSTRLNRVSFRPFARLETRLVGPVYWSVFLGPGGDLVELSTHTDSTEYAAEPTRWLLYGVFRAGLGLTLRTRSFALGISPMCEFPLVHQKYQLATPSGAEAVSEPWAARPQLALELWPFEGGQ